MSKNNIFFIYVFLLLLGSLSSFSLPPYNLIFVNFITYSLFLYLIVLFKEKKAKLSNFFFLGFTFGYGYFASSLYWVSHSLTFDFFKKNFKLKKNVYLGDIALSYQYIEAIIKKQNISFDDYFKKMLIHGVLHLIGYEHDSLKKYKKMNLLEQKIIRSI